MITISVKAFPILSDATCKEYDIKDEQYTCYATPCTCKWKTIPLGIQKRCFSCKETAYYSRDYAPAPHKQIFICHPCKEKKEEDQKNNACFSCTTHYGIIKCVVNNKIVCVCIHCATKIDLAQLLFTLLVQ